MEGGVVIVYTCKVMDWVVAKVRLIVKLSMALE